MNIILKREELNDVVLRYRIKAEEIAQRRRAGQFVILRAEKNGERVPLTIANADPDQGWIEIIFQAVGYSTKKLAELQENDLIPDLVGPLGKPTHIENFGRCLCIGGGVGIAPLYPIVSALKSAGNDITAIIGGRTKSLVILENDIRAQSDTTLIATDDGSYGYHGFVVDVAKQQIQDGNNFDFAIVVGPPIMMKVTTQVLLEFGIKTFVSLNPIMIDGTGMCGGCRINVFGKTKFACVDGPEFDAAGIDWDGFISRLKTYEHKDESGDKDKDKVEVDSMGHKCRLDNAVLGKEGDSILKEGRVPMPERDPKVRGKDFLEVTLGYTEAQAIREAKRCLQCKNALCVNGCPVNVDIPEFIDLIAKGDFAGAALKVSEKNLLPAVCGRVCPQETQCEEKCILGFKKEPVAIGNLERFAADWALKQGDGLKKQFVNKRNGKKVGIIGSGPAGLVAASELVQSGFEVVIYEALHKLGGVLIYGIPEFRLPKSILREEISFLKKCGVEIRCNFVVGKTASIDDLMHKMGCDAIFIGSGAGLPIFMNIPGEHSNGVYSANEYLTRSNLMKAYESDSKTPIMRGLNTVTVGGGNVAMDAARTALRLGASCSRIIYRRSEEEMPARREEIHHAKDEGIKFDLLTSPLEILSDDRGFVKGIKCIRMELGEPDESGRRRPKAILDSEFEIDCDVVIIAIGNRSNPLIPETTPDLNLNKWGNIVADENGRTSKSFVYAGGDIVTGAATVILAMGAGKSAANSIKEDLLS